MKNNIEEIEAEFMLALVDYSACVDAEKEKYRKNLMEKWLALDACDEYKGCMLMKTADIARKIVEKHPEWGAIRKAYM